MEILITSEHLSPSEVAHDLRTMPDWPESVELAIRRQGQSAFRSADATFLVAIVSAGGAVLGNFLAKLVDYATSHKIRQIVIEGERGKITIPADYSHKQLLEVVEILERMDRPKIELSK